MEIIRFDADDISNSVSRLSDEDIDKLSFGAIEMDAMGKILRYNAMEGAITGRKPEEVIGKNFFREVAPCSYTPAFYGKFREGVTKGELSTMFEYVFDYQMKPTRVKVHMKKSLGADTYWVFVKRL